MGMHCSLNTTVLEVVVLFQVFVLISVHFRKIRLKAYFAPRNKFIVNMGFLRTSMTKGITNTHLFEIN